MAIRYKKPLLNVPDICDGCGLPFTLEHALSCRKGGLVVARHNEIRDIIGDMASLVWSNVIREPVIREASGDDSALVADLSVRGVWLPQAEALFDVRVSDTDAQSYLSQSPSEVLLNAEKEKKVKYGQACEERRALFTPFCCSIDGMIGREGETFLKRLGDSLALKWDSNYSTVMGWLRARINFGILRASILCLRSTSKWRSLGIVDGASIGLSTINY